MKRLLTSLFIALQVPIVFALGDGDFTQLGFRLACGYMVMVMVAVFAFAYSWPLWDVR